MPVILERDIASATLALSAWNQQANSLILQQNKPTEQHLTQYAIDRFTINSTILNISRTQEALAVRYSLYLLQKNVPGNSVEVRVAPWGAVKILPGPQSDPHNLTPPDVIELTPEVWLRLACGITNWKEEQEAGNISAVGDRDDLHEFLPIVRNETQPSN